MVRPTRSHLAQKGRRGLGCLPKLEIEQGGRAGAAVVDVERRSRAALAEVAVEGVRRAC